MDVFVDIGPYRFRINL